MVCWTERARHCARLPEHPANCGVADPTELALIEIFAAHFRESGDDVLLGIGDDAAVTRLPPGRELVTAADALLSGTHFLPAADPVSVGYRSLAANLSDLAAMGAVPHWATLTLALPDGDANWVEGFARGFAQLAREHRVTLIGGDTVRGPLAISVTALGSVPSGSAITRSGAHVGELIFVSGAPGHAGAGCRMALGQLPVQNTNHFAARFDYPEPRVALGQALRGVATAMIDVSDGVATDMQRLLEASGKGADCAVPELAELTAAFGADVAVELFLTGGEDYELCFTVPPARAAEVTAIARKCGVPVTQLGVVTDSQQVRWTWRGDLLQHVGAGYEHFGEQGNDGTA